MTKLFSLLLLCGLMASCNSASRSRQNYIPLYVMPYYNSEPLQVNAGPYSERLMSDSREEMLRLSEEFKTESDRIHIIPMAILAVRLYDLGLKDDACYWYYTFQVRRNIVRNMLEDKQPGGPAFELISAFDSFKQLAGEWINGYSFGDPEKLAGLIEQIINESRNMGYVAQAYPGSAYEFKAESEQDAFVQQETEDMQEFADYLRQEKENILSQRKANGIEGKY